MQELGYSGAQSEDAVQGNTLNLQIGDIVLTAELADNSSVDALREMLSAGSLEIDMQDYGDMEKVGSLGQDLPVNDEQITTEAGDLILYQGNSLVIYYAPNTWNFTRLGKINGVSAEELQDILGEGDITVTLSLAE
nr:cyclophilin-like fold protein [Merdimonas faecis]